MSESQTRRVLIVGGGITGGVLALDLAQRGVEVVLVELRKELGGVGHGITLQGNGLKAFHAVGVFDSLADRGFAFDKLRMRSADGHVIAEIPAPPMGGEDVPPTMGALRGPTSPTSSPRRSRRPASTYASAAPSPPSTTTATPSPRPSPTAAQRPSTCWSAPTASARRCAG